MSRQRAEQRLASAVHLIGKAAWNSPAVTPHIRCAPLGTWSFPPSESTHARLAATLQHYMSPLLLVDIACSLYTLFYLSLSPLPLALPCAP